MNVLQSINFKNPKKLLFFLAFLVLITFSCKQNVTTNKVLASTEIQDNKPDSLDLEVEILMAKYNVPGVNIAFMENAALSSTRNYGVLQKEGATPVNDETMFSVGSVSKFVNAMLTLKLVKAGKLKLDEDINNYLLDWKVAKNDFNKENPVTLRHILSHTAGFSVHGFEDYYPKEIVPTTFQILTGASPAKNEEVKLIMRVGSTFKYSGGGITVIQKIIEDVTGMSYHEAASQLLFEPVGLQRMTFENPLPVEYGNIAKAHDEKGNPVALPRGYQAMPEMAASGLWTTITDFSKLLTHLLEVGENDASEFLTPQLIEDMITREKNSEFGLGPYVDYSNGYTIVGHNGSNDSYKSRFAIFWKEQKGYVVFTNGSSGTELINELRPILNGHLNL